MVSIYHISWNNLVSQKGQNIIRFDVLEQIAKIIHLVCLFVILFVCVLWHINFCLFFLCQIHFYKNKRFYFK